MKAKWFKNHVAYTMAKFGMSMCTLGMSAEFAKDGIAVNSLWPLTAIDTAAVRNLLGGESVAAMSRSPEILADAAHAIFAAAVARDDRQFLHRRGGAARGRRDGFFGLCAGRKGRARRRFLRAGRGVCAQPDQGGEDVRLRACQIVRTGF